MVIKRIRSEYMKKFKDPKWETCSRCYEELLKYRRTRRLLEQSHNPWFWGDWASDASDSGKSTSQGNHVEPLHLEDETPRCEEVPEQQTTPPDHLTKPVAARSQEIEVPPPNREPEVETNNRRACPVIATEVKLPVPIKPKSRQHASHKPTRTKSQPRKCQDPQDTKDDKENRHPFAMYGSGDRKADTASKKTHNVCPAASTKEIHESALRAKTRREVEKQMKKMDKRRALSVDLEKMAKAKSVADFDPWMTEYMRCYSARSC
ncbi:hypothetical protein ACEWY4_021463 [Coilia grayii]|uniref:Centriole, cilia and spindle-associated protein n=1 Tax=Coilia grayii TaxID=363190 RepID=A0ABD1J938_9TELE